MGERATARCRLWPSRCDVNQKSSSSIANTEYDFPKQRVERTGKQQSCQSRRIAISGPFKGRAPGRKELGSLCEDVKVDVCVRHLACHRERERYTHMHTHIYARIPNPWLSTEGRTASPSLPLPRALLSPSCAHRRHLYRFDPSSVQIPAALLAAPSLPAPKEPGRHPDNHPTASASTRQPSDAIYERERIRLIQTPPQLLHHHHHLLHPCAAPLTDPSVCRSRSAPGRSRRQGARQRRRKKKKKKKQTDRQIEKNERSD